MLRTWQSASKNFSVQGKALQKAQPPQKNFSVCPCLGPIFLVLYAQHTRRTACPIRRGMSIKGAFLVCMAQIIVKHSYPKTWIDHDAQVERLVQRGLEVADKESAKRILAYANYYRFTGYSEI